MTRRKRIPEKQLAETPPPDIDWERATPRCDNCMHRQPAKTILNPRSSRAPVLILLPVCRLYRFKTRDHALCKSWEGRNGDRLADDEVSP